MSENEPRKLVMASKVLEGRIAVVRAGVVQVAVTRRGGKVYAFKNLCPHAGSPLSAGTMRGSKVVCPRHGWTFDFVTGDCVDQPLYALTLIAAEERAGWIWGTVPETDPQ